MSGHANEIASGDRFEFGANWSRFLRLLDESRIEQAASSLRQMLGVDNLAGRSFLDVGSGSGLFSLAARQLGARVHSLDYDPKSVACTEELRRKYFPSDPQWVVENGSVLNRAYLGSLGHFDFVYSWGVLHHTGNLCQAMANVAPLVAEGGKLFIAIYNDQGWISRYWSIVKRQYNLRPGLRPLLIAAHAPYLLLGRLLARMLRGRLREARGMSLWYDMLDWLGGWPFEVASPDEVLAFYGALGFSPSLVRTVGGALGCNEFVFTRMASY